MVYKQSSSAKATFLPVMAHPKSLEFVLLLGTVFVLGAVAHGLKQSAITGYVLAGMLMRPLLLITQAVEDVAELEVAWLPFSTGLEI